MQGNQNIQVNIDSLIQNLIKTKVITKEKVEEIKLETDIDKLVKGQTYYTSFEKNLYSLINGELECFITSEIISDPIALITKDENGKVVASIMSENSFFEYLVSLGKKPHIDPTNQQLIIKLVTPEKIYNNENPINQIEQQRQEAIREIILPPVQRAAMVMPAHQAINNIAQPQQNSERRAGMMQVQYAMEDQEKRKRIRQAGQPQQNEWIPAQPQSAQAGQARNFNSNDSSTSNCYMGIMAATIATTIAISATIGGLLAGPMGVLIGIPVGFALGLFTSMLTISIKEIKSHHASANSENSLAQNTPFFNRQTENNNRLDWSTLRLTHP